MVVCLRTPASGIFREDIYTHFHRGVKRAIDLCFENNQIPHAHRIQKVQVIHRRRYHLPMAVPVRSDCAGNIDHVHHSPAQNIPQQVRVLRKHKLRHFGARSAHRSARQMQFGFRESIGF